MDSPPLGFELFNLESYHRYGNINTCNHIYLYTNRMETKPNIDIVSDVQLDMEPPKISNDDYTWYLNTERDIISYIFTYIHQCDTPLAIRYLYRFLDSKNHEFMQDSHNIICMLNNAIKYKISRPNTSINEIYNYPDVEIYMQSVGRGHTSLRFHAQCVQDLIHFIDTNQKTVSEFDFDRHQSLYNIIHEQNMYKQREKEQREREWNERIDKLSQEKTKSKHKSCIMS